MRRGIAIILLAYVLTLCLSVDVYATGLPRFTSAVSPEIELLAGVLSQTSWITRQGPTGDGNEYFRALKHFFAPYKDHEAVKIAQELTNLGFTYDAPIAFVCHLGPLPDLELKHEYSTYVVGRAKDRGRLERFRMALKDLSHKSNFLGFYEDWKPQFSKWINASSFDGDRVVKWLEAFFGKEASEFHLFLAAAMFPGGGYGANMNTPDGGLISFQVIRERGLSIAEPAFPAGEVLEYLSLHEWGHSFVNPALEKYSSEIKSLSNLFSSVLQEMEKQAYPDMPTIMNEQVLRAVTALAFEDLYGKAGLEKAVAREERASFYLTTDVIQILREYQADRVKYKVFDDFVPVLLQRLRNPHPYIWWHDVRIIMGALAILSVGSLVVNGRRLLKNRRI